MNRTVGQIAYEAYCAQTDWKSLVSGQPLPQWSEVKEEIKLAWEAAAMAVVRSEMFDAWTTKNAEQQGKA